MSRDAETRQSWFMIRTIGLRPKGPPSFSLGQRPGAQVIENVYAA
jgi:hypothetical protein